MHPDVFADLLAELEATVPRLPGAACRGRAELFDPIEGGEHNPRYWDVTVAAMNICRRECPVLADCRCWLGSLDPAQRPRGVVAGRSIAAKPHRS